MDLACLFLAPKLEKQDRKCVGGANSVSYRRHANLSDETAIDEEEKEKRFFRLMPNRNSVSHPILYTFFFYLSRKQHFLFVCLFVLGGWVQLQVSSVEDCFSSIRQLATMDDTLFLPGALTECSKRTE